MRVVGVFDINILLAGVGWRGKPYRCLELARSGIVEAVTCPELLHELSEKLETKLDFSAEQITDTLADLLSFLRLVTIPHTLRVISADPADDRVLECAVVAGATYIVTGDRRHLLSLRDYQGISIVSAADFLAKFAGS